VLSFVEESPVDLTTRGRRLDAGKPMRSAPLILPVSRCWSTGVLSQRA